MNQKLSTLLMVVVAGYFSCQNAVAQVSEIPGLSSQDAAVQTIEQPAKPARPPVQRTRYGVGYEFRQQQLERPEREERSNPPVAPELAGRPERPEGLGGDRVERPDRIERPESVSRPDRIDRPNRPLRPERPPRPGRP